MAFVQQQQHHEQPMSRKARFRPSPAAHFPLPLIALAATPLVLTVSPAYAQSAVNLGTAETSASEQNAPQDVQSAPYQAPTQVPLDAFQPTSVVSQQYIEKTAPPSANYTEILDIAPSVYSVSPNGPGLMENQVFSIRGFQDGFFNVTFDGIPWNDSNDFTHHSTSYFMAHDLGPMRLDSGPGTAATLGNATFGGTVSISSKDPLATTTITPYATWGSFSTQQYGAEFDSGSIDKYNGARLFIDGESLHSDGYLSFADQKRTNFFAKGVAPLGGNTVLSFVAMYNDLQQGVPIGATQAQIDTFGPSYALNNNPGDQAYHGDNQDRIHTDFEYIGLKSEFDGWTIDNKAYTFAYFHDGYNGDDVNDETPAGVPLAGGIPNGTVYGPNDVPGQHLVNYYRSWGDIFKAKLALPFGDVQAGAWGDWQTNQRKLSELDMTLNDGSLGGAFNPDQALSGTSIPGIDRDLHQTLTTIQPFVQVDWKPTEALTLSPGVRYDYFSRHVDAIVDVKSGNPATYTDTYDSLLPSLLAHYQLEPNWSAYAQVAKGFLAPNENFFNRGSGVDSSNTTLKPQQTWNYQLGTAWSSPRLTFGANVYYIDFNNEISPVSTGGITNFINLGGTTYDGVEIQGTVYIAYGVSVYANGSLNHTQDKTTNRMIPYAPTATAALGLIYNQDSWYVSLTDKWIGDSYDSTDASAPIANYSTLDAAIDYTLHHGAPNSPSIKVTINNLLDSHKIDALAGNTASGANLYWTIPGTSVFASISVPF